MTRANVVRSRGCFVVESGVFDRTPLEYLAAVAISYEWRGGFSNDEVNTLHAEAFETRVFGESEWNWRELVSAHSLGWVVSRDGTALVGFVNVVWDGVVHAWIQDTMVAARARGQGVGTRLVAVAKAGARAAGCEWLHVDFDDHLRDFYFGACGFKPTNAGLIALSE
jgi:GNAT superfamily N-acetyltransferase